MTEQEEQERSEREKEKKRISNKAPEYVFTISAEVYIAAKGKIPRDYDYRLLKARRIYFGLEENKRELYLSPIEQLAYLGEKLGAESVVDIRPMSSYYDPTVVIYGTALIPKISRSQK